MAGQELKAVITGDVVHSRALLSEQWLPALQNVFHEFGEPPSDWEIYRGDSFQLLLTPEKALTTSLLIKAVLRQHPPLDARMAIGLGVVDYHPGQILQANGSAFIHSGEMFDTLKGLWGIRTGEDRIDQELNLYLRLAGYAINRWTPLQAKVMAWVLQNPEATQKEAATALRTSQSNISEILTRAAYEEIQLMNNQYIEQLTRL